MQCIVPRWRAPDSKTGEPFCGKTFGIHEIAENEKTLGMVTRGTFVDYVGGEMVSIFRTFDSLATRVIFAIIAVEGLAWE